MSAIKGGGELDQDQRLIDLESEIERIEGVLGCVILTAGDGNPAEI